MKYLAAAPAAFALLSTAANAGGIDRSGQSIAPLFETGNYAEFSIGRVSPDVSGTALGASSGDMLASYLQVGAAYKRDLSDRVSFALIYDQPYGADVDYPTGTGYAFAGSTAELNTQALSAIVRYKFDGGYSVHGGLRAQTLEAEVGIPARSYTANGKRDEGYGYLIGAAYEKPEIALRVALTYYSEIEHKIDTTEVVGATINSTTKVDTPQAVNLDFQTGIAEDTLLFGGVRWVDWSSFHISPIAYVGAIGSPLVSYENDAITYTLGVGRKLNESWSVSAALSYEKHQDAFFTNLGPADGRTGLTLGAKYTKDNMVISGGVNYTMVGDAKTLVNSVPLFTSSFKDNSSIGAGIKIGFYF